mgnify:CR=1 FL=1
MNAAMSATENVTDDHGSRPTLLFHATSSARKESVAATRMHTASRSACEQAHCALVASIRRARGPRSSGTRPQCPRRRRGPSWRWCCPYRRSNLPQTLSGPIDDEPKQTHERNLPQKGGDLCAAVAPELPYLLCRGGEKDEYERAGGGAGVRGYGGGGFSFHAGNSWTARRRRTISLHALFYNRCVNLPRLSPWALCARVSS